MNDKVRKLCLWCGTLFACKKSGFSSRRLWCKPSCKRADLQWRYQMQNEIAANAP